MVDDDSTNAIDEVTSEEVVRHENTRVDNNDFLLGDEKRFVHHGQNTVEWWKNHIDIFSCIYYQVPPPLVNRGIYTAKETNI